MAKGEITPDEALTVTRVLDFQLKAIRVAREAKRARTAPLAEPSPFPRKEPSPPGRGQGEGAGRTRDGADIASARRPHPNPLPRGEGMARVHRDAHGNFPADRLHSTCIFRPPGWCGPLAA
jgi:hypothetical protein